MAAMLRYRIAHLMTLTALAAMSLGVFVAFERRIQSEQWAAEWIEAGGGRVDSEPVWPSWFPSRYRYSVTGVVLIEPFSSKSGGLPAGLDDPFSTDTDSTEEDRSGAGQAIGWIGPVNALPNLRKLDLSGIQIEAGDLSRIRKAHAITHLTLSRCSVESNFGSFRRFSALRHLSLANTEVTDTELETIGQLGRLQELDISNTAVTDRGLRYLEHLTELRSLNIADTSIGGDGMIHFTRMNRLTALAMGRSGPGSAELDESLASLFAELEPKGAKVHCGRLDLSNMPELRAIEVLSLTNVDVDHASLAAIARHRQLRVLNLDGTNLDDEGVTMFAGSQVESLSVRHTNVSATGLDAIARIRSLQTLRIDGLSIVGPALECLTTLKELQTLSIGPLEDASGATPVLVRIPNLRFLRLVSSSLSDEDVSKLKGMSTLEILEVVGENGRSEMFRLRRNGASEGGEGAMLEL